MEVITAAKTQNFGRAAEKGKVCPMYSEIGYLTACSCMQGSNTSVTVCAVATSQAW
jgi:hypothetical protein